MKRYGIVSGYFNPIHRGHIEYINAAKQDCDHLVVIVNNDYQVKLKGSTPFMDTKHRAFIVKNLKSVDEVFLSIDDDRSVAKSISMLALDYNDKNLVFYNSGYRNPENYESQEDIICNKYNIETKFLDLPKIYSSSELKNSVY